MCSRDDFPQSAYVPTSPEHRDGDAGTTLLHLVTS
jgi:hypothetical protein